MNALALAAVVLVVPAADRPHRIAFKRPTAADRLVVSQEDRRTVDVAVRFNGGRTDNTKTDGRKVSYTDEVLARATDGRPTKVRRVYDESVRVADGVRRPTVAAGTAVLATRTGDTFAFAPAAGGKLPPETAAELDGEFNRPSLAAARELLVPASPVRLNEPWSLDAAKLAARMGADDMTVDAAKSSATGKLTRTYDRDGRRWGAMEFRIELAVTKLSAAKTEVALRGGSKLTATLTLDACIDGTDAGYEATTITAGRLEGEAPGLEMVMKLDGTSGGKASEVRK